MAVPKYNIELRTQERVWETLSVEKGDQTEVRIEVAKFVGELLKDHAAKIWEDEDWRVDVTDHTGLILFSMQLMVTDAAAAMPMRR
jgi:hypothetical protein